MRWLLLLFCVGCRIKWSAWQGAPPRTANDVRLALHATDESAGTLARSVLGRDSHVTVVDLDESVIATPAADCGSARCPAAVELATQWARQQGLDYVAIATVATQYRSRYVCTKYDTSDLLSKNGGACVEGHETDQATTATFLLDVYDAVTHQRVPALSTEVKSTALGPREQSESEARYQLGMEAPAKAVGFPDQIHIGPSGGIIGSDARDGFYAVYRGSHYLGGADVRGAGTASERVTALRCCFTPSAGDALVARGRTHHLELALEGVVGSLTFDGDRRLAIGGGLHVRYFPLDGGFRFGAGFDWIGNGAVDATALLVTPEIGWGIRPAPAWHLSANLGAGMARAQQVIAGMNDAAPLAITAHAIATLRAQLQLDSWWYVAGDAGYVYSGTFDKWDGDGFAAARPMSVRSPVLRLVAGVDL